MWMMSDPAIAAKISAALRRNLKGTWQPAFRDFTDGKIGKLRLMHIISTDLARMEHEITVIVDLLLKQKESQSLREVWDDNLQTKALVEALLAMVEPQDSLASHPAHTAVPPGVKE